MALSTENVPMPRKLGGKIRAAATVEMLLEAAFFSGLAAITVGAALIFLPAGLIVGGALTVTTAFLYAKHAPVKATTVATVFGLDDDEEHGLETPSMVEVDRRGIRSVA